MSETRVLKLFSTPVVLHEVVGSDELNAELESAINARRSETEGLQLSNRHGWQSGRDFPTWAGDAGRRVVDEALALANRETVRAGGPGRIRWKVHAWANASESGAFNMPHVHGGSFWSAVYYVRIGEGEGGQLVLHDPRMPALRMHAPALAFKSAGTELRAGIAPKEGMMVLFPAWLSHSVEPWEGSGTRMSVAMNIRFAPGA